MQISSYHANDTHIRAVARHFDAATRWHVEPTSYGHPQQLTATLIGYARCSTDKQDLTAQRQALKDLDVAPDRIYTDKGLTGTNRARPGLDQAMAAVRKGDTLVVPKLDRLARSVPDFEADLIRMRTREGMAIARAKGKLRGKQPKLSTKQARELRRMYETGDYSVSDLAEIFSVSRPTIYRTLERSQT